MNEWPDMFLLCICAGIKIRFFTVHIVFAVIFSRNENVHCVFMKEVLVHLLFRLIIDWAITFVLDVYYYRDTFIAIGVTYSTLIFSNYYVMFLISLRS